MLLLLPLPHHPPARPAGGGGHELKRIKNLIGVDNIPSSSYSGKSALHATTAKRSSGLLRPTSPKSPVASASAFESVEGSDDEDNLTDNSKIDTTYLHTNGNAVSLFSDYKKKVWLI